MLPSASLIQKQSTEAQILTQQEPPDNKSQALRTALHQRVCREPRFIPHMHTLSARGPNSDVILNAFLAFQCHCRAVVFRAEREVCAFLEKDLPYKRSLSGARVQKSHKRNPHNSLHLILQEEIQKRSTDSEKKVTCIYLHEVPYIFFVSVSCEIYHHGHMWEQISVLIYVNVRP